jgi:hypothetical protein
MREKHFRIEPGVGYACGRQLRCRAVYCIYNGRHEMQNANCKVQILKGKIRAFFILHFALCTLKFALE